MKFPTSLSVTVLLLTSLGKPAFAQTPLMQIQLGNPDSPQMIANLRAKGQAGIDALLNGQVAVDGKTVRIQNSASLTTLPNSIRTVLDAVCQQRDCYASRLYWYTDLEAAKVAAKATGKPILSLHLLGRLDEELSCANSRFFRVALYPNAEVSQVLRDRFILHWKTVRPAPKVTIDFGDGRKLERTITGNSIHYILDAEGRPVDALPGLYSPKAFLRHLEQAEQAIKELAQLTGRQNNLFLRQYHQERLAEIEQNWTTDLEKLGLSLPLNNLTENTSSNNNPTAEQAAPIALTKMVVETPLLRAISNNRQRLERFTNEAIWNQIAQLHRAEAQLDQNSQRLIQAKNPNAYLAENSLQRTVNNFEQYMALDTVRNEYLLRSQIHEWYLQGRTIPDLEALNGRVYAELFLTPNSDPWLGLLTPDTYTGIENDGIKQ